MAVKKAINKQKSKMAITGLILGIIGLFPGWGLFFGIPALVLGIISLNKIKKNKIVSGKKLAIASIVLGGISIVFTVILYGVFLYFAFVSKSGPFIEVRNQATQQILMQNVGALELYKKNNEEYPKTLEELTKKNYSTFPFDHYMQPVYYKVSSDGQSYDLRSLGADNKFGTSDDVFPVSEK